MVKIFLKAMPSSANDTTAKINPIAIKIIFYLLFRDGYAIPKILNIGAVSSAIENMTQP